MTVRKKGNKWYCRFQIDGIRYERTCKGATSQKDAEKCEAVIKAEIMHGNYNFGKSIKKAILKDAVEIWKTHKIDNELNKLNYKSDEYRLNKIVEYFGINKPIEEITPEAIEKFKENIKTQEKRRIEKILNPEYPQKSKKKYLRIEKIERVELSNATLNRYISILRKMFNLCIRNKQIKENPCKETKKLRENNYKIRYLTEDEQKRLFSSINDVQFLNLVKLALYTGMRKGEILALKWDNIDSKYIHILESKSGNSRKIPNVGQLKELLNSISQDNEYVFYNHQTNTKYIDIKRQFSTAIKKADISNFRFHDLRHTAATRMVNKGIDLVVVKEILGHADIKTTMRYAHSLEETKIKAINILSSF